MLDVTKTDINDAVDKALSVSYKNNLRDRNPAVAFDTKVRGELGEIEIRKLLKKYNINCESPDGLDYTHTNLDILIEKGKGYSAEIKTSLLPSNCKNIQDVLNRCDIKILATAKDMEKDISRDIYLQIYYKIPTKEREDFLNGTDFSTDLKRWQIYDMLNMEDYLESAFFVAWAPRDSIFSYLNGLKPEDRLWTFDKSQKSFWRCPLQKSRTPNSLFASL